MKARFLIHVITFAAVLVLGGSAAQAWDKGDDLCSDATRRGKYAFTISGQTFTPNIVTDGVAMTTFDGAGHFTQVGFVLSRRDIHTVVASLTPPGASGPVPTSVHSDGFKVGDVDGDKDAD